MRTSVLVRIAVPALLLSLVAQDAIAGRAQFTCRKDQPRCYFSIFRYSQGKLIGVMNFPMKSGESDWVGGVLKGDVYCIDTAGVPDPKTCKKWAVEGIQD